VRERAVYLEQGDEFGGRGGVGGGGDEAAAVSGDNAGVVLGGPAEVLLAGQAVDGGLAAQAGAEGRAQPREAIPFWNANQAWSVGWIVFWSLFDIRPSKGLIGTEFVSYQFVSYQRTPAAIGDTGSG